MSRLDSAIQRLEAQRDCLESAAALIRGVEGHILELGLGNGRTFDHLRWLFPDRDIFVFDRHVAAHPSCVPPEPHMILGEVLETLTAAHEWISGPVALAHNDIGCGKPDESSQIANALPRILSPLLASGAVVVSDQDLRPPEWDSLALPAATARGRYFMWRTPARQ